VGAIDIGQLFSFAQTINFMNTLGVTVFVVLMISTSAHGVRALELSACQFCGTHRFNRFVANAK
jgi:hypothetical protein